MNNYFSSFKITTKTLAITIALCMGAQASADTVPASPIKPTAAPKPRMPTDSPSNVANVTGFPDLIVPAGMTKEGLPVTISFFGPAFSEAKLLAYGYDFEQASKSLKLPKSTPALPSDVITF